MPRPMPTVPRRSPLRVLSPFRQHVDAIAAELERDGTSEEQFAFEKSGRMLLEKIQRERIPIPPYRHKH